MKNVLYECIASTPTNSSSKKIILAYQKINEKVALQTHTIILKQVL